MALHKMTKQLSPFTSIRAETAGHLLREWRRLNRVKQDVVALNVGVTQAAVSRWENGHDIPSPLALQRLEAMMAAFDRDELAAERAIISTQSTMRGLFRLDGMVFKAASRGFAAVWPDFVSEIGTALEDRLINESARFLAVPENRRDMRLGRIAYVRGVSEQHIENSGPGMQHLWTACVRKLRGEVYIEMVYEPDTLGRKPGIVEVFTL